MELDQRKNIILKTIIKNYLESGEPVGSRTISKFSGLNLSSATIRNEMSDLEELGYIEQPHTSAGRIPTDKGYRFYVNSITQDSQTAFTDMATEMFQRVDRMEMMLKTMVKALAVNTDYAALISGPSIGSNKIKYLQLSVPEAGKVLLILVLEGNVIRNELITIPETLDQETVRGMDILLNNYLSGLSLDEISDERIKEVVSKGGPHKETIRTIVDTVIELIENDKENGEVFTSGAKNIFKYPELSDAQRATELITAFEEKNQLRDLVREVTSLSLQDGPDEADVKVYIGGEGPIRNMQNCSLVTANYEMRDGMKGVIGVIGPKRMDYEKVMNTMKVLKQQLDRAFRDF